LSISCRSVLAPTIIEVIAGRAIVYASATWAGDTVGYVRAVPSLDPRTRARELAAESLARSDARAWFEEFYAEAEAGRAVVPWR
jgi:hypothetical protein